MTATCSTCVHWKPPEQQDCDPDLDEEPPSPYGVCKVAESKNGRPVVPLAPARAMDASGYHASLGTLPTFGCSLHATVADADVRRANEIPTALRTWAAARSRRHEAAERVAALNVRCPERPDDAPELAAWKAAERAELVAGDELYEIVQRTQEG